VILPISLISLDLVSGIVKSSPNGKAAGIDGLPGELFKYGGDSVIMMLSYLFTLCQSLECIPREWESGLVIPIYKKGPVSDVANFRPITITCAIRRLYERVFFTEIKAGIDQRLLPSQFGFRPGRSVLDPIVIMQEMIHRYPSLKVVLLDICAAYDSIDRRILWDKCANEFGLSKHHIGVLKALNEFNSVKVMVDGQLSESIMLNRGLIQGSSISPFLFNMYINDFIRNLNSFSGVDINKEGYKLNNLFFADDAALFHTDDIILQRLLNIAEQWGLSNGLRFSPNKCQFLARYPCKVSIYDTNIVRTKEIKYLGLIFNINGINWNASLNPRLQSARQLIALFRSKGMNAGGWRPAQGILLYKSFIRPVFEFATYIMILPQQVLLDMQKIQNEALRAILSLPTSTSLVALHVAFCLDFLADRNSIMVNKMMLKMLDNSSPSLSYMVLNSCLESSKFHPNYWRKDSLGSLDKKSVQAFRLSCFVNYQQNSGRIGSQLQIDPFLRIDPLLGNAPLLPRAYVYLFNQWRFGRIACYGKCYNCLSVPRCSQAHVLKCLKIDGLLVHYVDSWNIVVNPHCNDILTSIISSYMEFSNDIDKCHKIFRILQYICVKALNWKKLMKSFDSVLINCHMNDQLYHSWLANLQKLKDKLPSKVTLNRRRTFK
jgi:hypothetical protein